MASTAITHPVDDSHAPPPLSDRQRAIVLEALRCGELVSIYQYPDGRREQLGATSWNHHAVELPSDPEVRMLVRLGYLNPGPPSPATTFSAGERARLLARAR